MTTEEKSRLLASYENMSNLGCLEYNIIKQLSLDDDDFIRSQCAALLVNYDNKEEAKNLLLHLSYDLNSFVRTEAYDSLGVFSSNEVIERLLVAIKSEPDNLARRYSILSLTNIVYTLKHNYDDYIIKFKEIEAAESADECKLAFYYSIYLLGEGDYLGNILSFLTNEDYHLRCSVLHLLREIDIDCVNDKEHISYTINTLLLSETSEAVISTALETLKQIGLGDSNMPTK